MSSDNEDKSSINKSALNRRNMLLGGTTLAAATAIVTSAPIAATQAQAQQPAPSGVFQFTATFKEFPPRSFPPSFVPTTIMEQTMDDIKDARRRSSGGNK
jgi:secreted PhoX family phosphatase